MPRRKPEKTVNLVRPKNDKTYRVVPDYEMVTLRSDVVFERVAEQNGMYGYFYFEKD